MAIIVKPVENKTVWEEFVKNHQEANFLQSWGWGQVNKRLGKLVFYRGYYENNRLIGVMLGVGEEAKRGRYISVAAGPLLDWSNQELVDCWHDDLMIISTQANAVFARVRPQLLSSPSNLNKFKKLGFIPAKMHLEAELTSQLLLDKPSQQIMANFRKNTRREIKHAKKSGIKISKSNNPDDIKAFYELQLETAQRHKFVPFSYDRLFYEFDEFVKTDNATLYSAYSPENQLIAQAFLIFYGSEVSYHYGASTPLARSQPGAYLLQWVAINDAINKGFKRYNFWGVVKPEDTKHRFYGVSVFKRGFRGEDVEYLHAHDLVINKPKYAVNWLVESIRKRIRRV